LGIGPGREKATLVAETSGTNKKARRVHMKFLQTATYTVILALASAPALLAQEPAQEKEKQSQQDEEKKKQPPPEKAKPKPQASPQSEPKPQEQPKSEPKPDKEKQHQKEQEKATKQQQKQSGTQSNQASRGSRTNARRIPPERFQANFGSQHHFRMQQRDDRRFQYGGYWFEFVDVLPAGFSYDDECYIEEDGDDYYLVDVVHPEIRVIVIVVG
jgi:outer membrane biosynthesis protein TonB